MSKPDFLFELLQSLNNSEKRHVRSYISARYLAKSKERKLFEELIKSSSYNKKKLEQHYPGLNKLKHNLRGVIINCLRSYPHSLDIETKVYHLLQDYRFLYLKGFYDQAVNALAKASELAEKYHLTSTVLQIISEEKHRLLESRSSGLVTELDQKLKDMETVGDRYFRELEYSQIYFQIFSFYRTNAKSVQLPEVQKLVKEFEACKPPGELDSIHSHLYFLGAATIFAQLKNRPEEMLTQLKKMVEIWGQYPDLVEAYPHKLQIQLANYSSLLAYLGRYEEAVEYLEKIVDSPKTSFNSEAESFQNVAQIKLLLAMNGQLDDPNLVEWIEDGLKKYDRKINMARRKTIWRGLMILHLLKEEYRRCYFWCEKLLMQKRHQIRQDLYYEARFIELIILFDSGEIGLLEDRKTALYMYLRRHENLDDFKSLVLAYFQKLFSSPLEEHPSIFNDFQEALVPFEEAAEAYQSIIYWVKVQRQKNLN